MKRSNIFKRIPIPVWFIFVTGFLLRWAYVLFTSAYERQHDIGDFTSLKGGHFDYIGHIMNEGLLPDFDPTLVFQFAHPPLHHMLCAWWLKLMTGVFGVSFDAAVESLQYLTLLYSVALMYVCYRIFCYFKLRGIPLYIATAVISFHPVFILLSGSLNNDLLSVLLMAVSLLFALKWYRKGRWRDLIGSAIAVGLAMMTKLSAVFVAFPIAFLMLIVLIRSIKKHRLKRCIGQLGTYAAVSFPLGLWFPVYNLIRWDMPLFFVYPLREDIAQYLGNQSFISRIFDFSPYQLSSIYEQWMGIQEAGIKQYNEFNPLVVALKNSMFGEAIRGSTFDKAPIFNVVAGVVFFVGALLAFAAFFYMIYDLVRNRKFRYFERMAMGVFFVTMMIGYYVAAYKYPFVCTMDFRYIPLTVLVGALFLGLGAERCLAGKDKKTPGIRAFALYSCLFAVIVFCLSSAVMYIGLLSV